MTVGKAGGIGTVKLIQATCALEAAALTCKGSHLTGTGPPGPPASSLCSLLNNLSLAMALIRLQQLESSLQLRGSLGVTVRWGPPKTEGLAALEDATKTVTAPSSL